MPAIGTISASKVLKVASAAAASPARCGAGKADVGALAFPQESKGYAMLFVFLAGVATRAARIDVR
jgi:hypothetical protein